MNIIDRIKDFFGFGNSRGNVTLHPVDASNFATAAVNRRVQRNIR